MDSIRLIQDRILWRPFWGKWWTFGSVSNWVIFSWRALRLQDSCKFKKLLEHWQKSARKEVTWWSWVLSDPVRDSWRPEHSDPLLKDWVTLCSPRCITGRGYEDGLCRRQVVFMGLRWLRLLFSSSCSSSFLSLLFSFLTLLSSFVSPLFLLSHLPYTSVSLIYLFYILLIFCGLFCNAVSVPDYAVSTGGTISEWKIPDRKWFGRELS